MPWPAFWSKSKAQICRKTHSVRMGPWIGQRFRFWHQHASAIFRQSPCIGLYMYVSIKQLLPGVLAIFSDDFEAHHGEEKTLARHQ